MTATTRGVHHIGLTVPDIESTQAFFIDVLDFTVVGEKPNYPAVFVSDGTVMLTLWQVSDPATAAPFDRRGCVGLHHLALWVADAAALEALHRQLVVRSDVIVEFAPEPLGQSGAQHMMCSIPGGIRVEFVATASER